MSISSQVWRNDYVGNGATAIYPYGFMAPDQNDLLVVMGDLSTPQVLTTLALGVDYTVDVAGANYPNGGNVDLLTSVNLPGGVLPNNFTLSIVRNTALTQPASIRNQGAYYPDYIEDALDRLCAEIQDLQGQLNRSILFPINETDGPLAIPAAATRANGFLGFGSGGAPVILPLPLTVSPLPAVFSFALANNQSVAVPITGLVLNPLVYRSYTIKFDLYLLAASGNEAHQVGSMSLIWSQHLSTWTLTVDAQDVGAVEPGITFSMSGNQVMYKSTNFGTIVESNFQYSISGAFSL